MKQTIDYDVAERFVEQHGKLPECQHGNVVMNWSRKPINPVCGCVVVLDKALIEIEQFADENTRSSRNCQTYVDVLYDAYKSWCLSQGFIGAVETQKDFVELLSRCLDFSTTTHYGRPVLVGIRLW